MRFRIFTEPQLGATYEDQLRMAQAAERLGFDAFFRSDHFLTMAGDGLPGPTDSWVTLGALARETTSIRLGTLVSSATFRLPSLLAIQVAQVDAMSNGRVELGLGTGWFEAEHRALGIPFPGKRFDRFEEQLEIITGLWATPVGESYSFNGEHYTLVDAPALPKPAQASVPLIIGGGGAKRTPALAARYASEFNLPFGNDDETAAAFDRVREASAAAGRPPGDVRFSVAQTTIIGRDDAEVARRAEAVGRTADAARRDALGGTAAQVVDRIGKYRDMGAETIYLQLLDIHDLDALELIAAEVVPQLR
ncbi:LLM class F420-dependent oxidoreductase [Rathayibacter sp. YIM 133350]|uniref:LLM class F420-dependent oxidoreductase n=1 Tax=Rathayibacter sp. YIM 133350 TaxID=3131992 RepID=UPI00307EA267